MPRPYVRTEQEILEAHDRILARSEALNERTLLGALNGRGNPGTNWKRLQAALQKRGAPPPPPSSAQDIAEALAALDHIVSEVTRVRDRLLRLEACHGAP